MARKYFGSSCGCAPGLPKVILAKDDHLNPWAFASGPNARRERIWLSWCDIKEFPTVNRRQRCRHFCRRL